MPVEQPAIAIVPVGKIPADVLRGRLPAIEARFHGRVPRLAKGGLPRPDDAFAARRRQYQAGPIPDRLLRLRLDAERLLGVADLDLFAPGLNFIFGQAQRGGPVGVIALARLHPEFWGRPADPHLFLQRAIKEAIHELGHTYGLEHCDDPTCVMRFSHTLEETDRKTDRFCTTHEAQLTRALGVTAY